MGAPRRAREHTRDRVRALVHDFYFIICFGPTFFLSLSLLTKKGASAQEKNDVRGDRRGASLD
jgi:hypothetical protein